MRYDDLKANVKGRFFKEITIDNDEDDITYIFPDTKEFISILKRDLNKSVVKKI